MATATNIKQADDYVMVGKDGQTRTSSELGDATLVDGGKGGEKAQFTDWKPWAYTAGGGALAYILAKKLFDDDDDDGKGKKKSGFLNSIIPYLAAVGGGLGGYALSGMGSGNGEKGRAGEAAFKVDKDGKTSVPKELPRGGNLERATAAATGVVGTALGTRALAHRYYTRADRMAADAIANYDNANMILRDAQSLRGTARSVAIDRARALRILGDDLSRQSAVAHALNGKRTLIRDAIRWLGGRPGMRGRGPISLLSIPLTWAGISLGNAMDENRNAAIAVRKKLGLNVDD